MAGPRECHPDASSLTPSPGHRLDGTPRAGELLDRLSLLTVEDRVKIGELSGQIRSVMRVSHHPQRNVVNETLMRPGQCLYRLP